MEGFLANLIKYFLFGTNFLVFVSSAPNIPTNTRRTEILMRHIV